MKLKKIDETIEVPQNVDVEKLFQQFMSYRGVLTDGHNRVLKAGVSASDTPHLFKMPKK